LRDRLICHFGGRDRRREWSFGALKEAFAPAQANRRGGARKNELLKAAATGAELQGGAAIAACDRFKSKDMKSVA